ncbi:MAG: phosphoribosylformylglycinamidine synthase subunit PurQ [Candidatus Aureabacteria bacterium]|nr:phosphoribosylformylglycinamidine synthase subunit PurQ [Candidatus Auribacterota bacterium]
MKFGVVVFPGSNCNEDCYWALKNDIGVDVRYIWHKSTEIDDLDAIVLPGGFSYGDYLRVGSIARFSPVMNSVIDFAKKGKLVIGICNGFQILLEAGLLPGAMLKNKHLSFICKYVSLKVENSSTPFTIETKDHNTLNIPIAHGEGNYYIDNNGLDELKKNNQIVFKYSNKDGKTDDNTNPNGSVENIAGICNKEKNVLGMMPHPERCCNANLGSVDGQSIFLSMKNFIKQN